MKTNDIKAVEMTREIRESHYEQLEDKTPEEQIAFYKAKAAHVDRWVEEEIAQKSRKPSSDWNSSTG